jgi:hypothetical protein
LVTVNTMSGSGDLKWGTGSFSEGFFSLVERVSFFVSPKVDSAILCARNTDAGRWFCSQSKAANDPAASVVNHQGGKSELEERVDMSKAVNDVLVQVKSRLREVATQLRKRAPFDSQSESLRWLEQTAPSQAAEERWAKAVNIKRALQVPVFEQSVTDAPASESMELLSPTPILSLRVADSLQDTGRTVWETTSNALSAVVYEPG